MSEINYEEEVKKNYPDAWCQSHPFWFHYYVGTKETNGWLSKGTNLSRSLAWQSAYLTLKQQNKL